jgi:hypothetical protein
VSSRSRPVPITSPFQVLWLSVSAIADSNTIQAIRFDLEARESASLIASERQVIASAIAELDGLIVSRLSKQLL